MKKATKKAAVKKADNNGNLLYGKFREGNTAANILKMLEGGKAVSKKALEKAAAEKGVNIMGRVYRLSRFGKKSKLFTIEITEDKVRLLKGKAKKSA